MDILQKNISNLIETQFPETFREEGPVFVLFVKSYFEWMELKGNPLYYSRNFLEHRDIDETPDEFLVYFKEMYLKNISITSAEGTRTLVKHSLDLYRSKGTEQGIDLLFRAEYGVPAQVYYPSTDLFKLSNGNYVKPKYIQITLCDQVDLLDQREIKGLNSGAVAFVEKAVRKFVAGKLASILYISALYGNFIPGEPIGLADNSITLSPQPFVLGSIGSFSVDVNGSGANFALGDIVDVYSLNGGEAKARVSNITNSSGLVSFTLNDGGYGYSSNTKVYISNSVFSISNVVTSSYKSYIDIFDQIIEPKGTINYLNKTGTINVLDNIFTYSNNVVASQSIVTSISEVNTTTGVLSYSTVSGNITGLTFYTSSNVVSANVDVSNGGVTDQTAYANVIGISNTIVLSLTSGFQIFLPNEQIYQLNNGGETANATVVSFAPDLSKLTITNVAGCFNSNTIFGRTSNSIATINTQSFSIGIFGISNSGFGSALGNIVYTNKFTGTINSISFGTSASVNVSSNSFTYTETVSINTDYIASYSNTFIGANTYNFPAMPTANGNTSIGDALTFANITLGKITQLTQINPGQNYNYPPFVLVYDSYTYPYKKYDTLSITINNLTSNFTPGDVITQASTNGRALIKSSNSTVLTVQNLRFDDLAKIVANSTIIGSLSGATANVVSVYDVQSSPYIGVDAKIDIGFTIGSGVVAKLDLVSSGFGFLDKEQVFFYKNNNYGTALSNLIGNGKSQGYYADTNSFLSNRNKLRDGEYYQEYSYDVISSIQYDKYKELLKQIMHVAGTKQFATHVYKNKINSSIGIRRL